jgi:VanZ family protein
MTPHPAREAAAPAGRFAALPALAGAVLVPLFRHAVGRRLAYAVLASAAIFVLSSLPVRLPARIPHLDKVFHIVQYFCLGLTYFNAGTRGGQAVTLRRSLLVLLAAVLYGVSDEWHQAYVPGRTADWQDVVADAIGAALAVWLGWRLRALAGAAGERRGHD